MVSKIRKFALMVEITENIDGLRSLSQLFTQSNFNRIVRKGDLRTTNSRITKHLKNYKKETYFNVISKIYDHLQKNYRSEYFYKNALLNKIVLGKYSINTTTLLDEFKIGSSCADVVLLNGEINIYEIKTELDSLSKLEKQLNDYLKFANKVYVVSSSKHLVHLLREFKASDIGIIEYTKTNRLRKLKEANENSGRLDISTIFKTLRKPEYLEIINEVFGYIPEVPNTKIFRECLSLANEINPEQFQTLVLKQLKKRRLQSPEHLTSSVTPEEIRHICHTMDLKENEYNSLYLFLNKQI